MEVTKTIKLTKEEVKTVEEFLSLTDRISDTSTTISMHDVFSYFADNADIVEDYKFQISDVIQIDDIG